MSRSAADNSRGPGHRLSPERVQEILDEYQAWDPQVESSQELALRLGTTKATLYKIVGRAGVPMRGTNQPRPSATDENYSQAEAMARVALQTMLERLEYLSRHCDELEKENADLTEQVATLQKELRAAKRRS